MFDTLLFDLDGTLYFRGIEIPGANAAIKQLRNMNYKLGFITNTDARRPVDIHTRAKKFGIDFELNELFTPVVAARKFMEQNPDKSCYLLTHDDVRDCLKDLNINDKNPDYIVIGDFSDKLNFDEINKVFKYLMNGAEILALSKTMYYFSSEGITINTGAFVSMFENAAEKEALLLGKPSTEFFDIALASLGSKRGNTLIVGDDISVDIVGAKNLNTKGVLVKTGHYTDEILNASKTKPDYILNSVTDLPELLKQIQ